MLWLVDEGLPKIVIEWLQQRGDDVLDIASSEWRGEEDIRLWRLAGYQGRIILTRDVGFMHPDVFPAPVGMVIICIPNTLYAETILQVFQSGLESVPEDSLYQTLTVIEPGKVRQRPMRTIQF